MGEGNVFSLFTGGRGVPTQGTYPSWSRYLTPSQVWPGVGTYHLAKVPTPSQVQWGRYPKVPTPPSQAQWKRGYPKVPTPQPRYLPPAKSNGGGTPRYLLPGQGTYPPPSQAQWGGVGTYPQQRYLPPPPHQARSDGGYPKVPTPARSDGGGGVPQGTYPLSKVPTPLPRCLSPPRDRTAYGVLDTPRSVCLLRSRRGTFLFCNCI